MTQKTRKLNRELEDYVCDFEKAWVRSGFAELADFLPGPGHPDELPIFTELMRADMEFRWHTPDRRTVAHYVESFLQFTADDATRNAIAFEEYRLRAADGEIAGSPG